MTPGDVVLGYDNETKKVVPVPVNTLFNLQRDHYYILKTNTSKVINVTAEHPFYTPTGYKEVQFLKVGDTIFDRNSEQLTPSTITSLERINETVQVYNLHVNGTHNFFAEGVLVHNKNDYHGCCCVSGGAIISDSYISQQTPCEQWAQGVCGSTVTEWSEGTSNCFIYPTPTETPTPTQCVYTGGDSCAPPGSQCMTYEGNQGTCSSSCKCSAETPTPTETPTETPTPTPTMHPCCCVTDDGTEIKREMFVSNDLTCKQWATGTCGDGFQQVADFYDVGCYLGTPTPTPSCPQYDRAPDPIDYTDPNILVGPKPGEGAEIPKYHPLISEIHTGADTDRFIEIFNPTTEPMNLDTYFIIDSDVVLYFPPGITLPPHSAFVLYEEDLRSGRAKYVRLSQPYEMEAGPPSEGKNPIEKMAQSGQTDVVKRLTGLAAADAPFTSAPKINLQRCIKDCMGVGGTADECETQCKAYTPSDVITPHDTCLKDCLQVGGTPAECKEQCGQMNLPCKQETKKCPNGNLVSRVGPKCEFAPCETTTPISGTPEAGTCEDQARAHADEAQQHAVFELSSAGAMPKMRAPDYDKYIAQECASVTPTPRPEFPIISDSGKAYLMHAPTEEEQAAEQQSCPQHAMMAALQGVRDSAHQGEVQIPDFGQVVADACGGQPPGGEAGGMPGEYPSGGAVQGGTSGAIGPGLEPGAPGCPDGYPISQATTSAGCMPNPTNTAGSKTYCCARSGGGLSPSGCPANYPIMQTGSGVGCMRHPGSGAAQIAYCCPSGAGLSPEGCPGDYPIMQTGSGVGCMRHPGSGAAQIAYCCPRAGGGLTPGGCPDAYPIMQTSGMGNCIRHPGSGAAQIAYCCAGTSPTYQSITGQTMPGQVYQYGTTNQYTWPSATGVFTLGAITGSAVSDDFFKSSQPEESGSDYGSVIRHACTMDVKQCPDGSFVSRSGLNCEFRQCPEVAPAIVDESGGDCSSTCAAHRDQCELSNANWVPGMGRAQRNCPGIYDNCIAECPAQGPSPGAAPISQPTEIPDINIPTTAEPDAFTAPISTAGEASCQGVPENLQVVDIDGVLYYVTQNIPADVFEQRNNLFTARATQLFEFCNAQGDSAFEAYKDMPVDQAIAGIKAFGHDCQVKVIAQLHSDFPDLEFDLDPTDIDISVTETTIPGEQGICQTNPDSEECKMPPVIVTCGISPTPGAPSATPTMPPDFVPPVLPPLPSGDIGTPLVTPEGGLIVQILDGFAYVIPVPPQWQQCFQDVNVDDQLNGNQIDHDNLPGLDDLLNNFIEDELADLEHEVIASTEAGEQAITQIQSDTNIAPEVQSNNIAQIHDEVDRIRNEAEDKKDNIKHRQKPKTGDILVFKNIKETSSIQRKADAWDENDEVSKGGELNVAGHKEGTEPWGDNFLQIPSSDEVLHSFKPKESFFKKILELLTQRKRHLLITTVARGDAPHFSIYNPTTEKVDLGDYYVLYAEKLANNRLKRVWSAKLPSEILDTEKESVVAVNSAHDFERAYNELPNSLVSLHPDDSRVLAASKLNGIPQVGESGVLALVFWPSKEELPVEEVQLTGAAAASLVKTGAGGLIEKPVPGGSLQSDMPVIVKPGPQPVKKCKMETQTCPDGSLVSRTGPNCEFAPCTDKESKTFGDCVSKCVGTGPVKMGIVESTERTANRKQCQDQCKEASGSCKTGYSQKGSMPAGDAKLKQGCYKIKDTGAICCQSVENLNTVPQPSIGAITDTNQPSCEEAAGLELVKMDGKLYYITQRLMPEDEFNSRIDAAQQIMEQGYAACEAQGQQFFDALTAGQNPQMPGPLPPIQVTPHATPTPSSTEVTDNSKPPTNVGPKPAVRPCTMETKTCPDGNLVSRTGSDCAFAPCPEAGACRSGFRATGKISGIAKLRAECYQSSDGTICCQSSGKPPPIPKPAQITGDAVVESSLAGAESDCASTCATQRAACELSNANWRPGMGRATRNCPGIYDNCVAACPAPSAGESPSQAPVASPSSTPVPGGSAEGGPQIIHLEDVIGQYDQVMNTCLQGVKAQVDAVLGVLGKLNYDGITSTVQVGDTTCDIQSGGGSSNIVIEEDPIVVVDGWAVKVKPFEGSFPDCSQSTGGGPGINGVVVDIVPNKATGSESYARNGDCKEGDEKEKENDKSAGFGHELEEPWGKTMVTEGPSPGMFFCKETQKTAEEVMQGLTDQVSNLLQQAQQQLGLGGGAGGAGGQPPMGGGIGGGGFGGAGGQPPDNLFGAQQLQNQLGGQSPYGYQASGGMPGAPNAQQLQGQLGGQSPYGYQGSTAAQTGPNAQQLQNQLGGQSPYGYQVMQPQSFGGNPLNGPQAGSVYQYYGGATPGQVAQPQSFGGNPLNGPQSGTIMQYYGGATPGQVAQPQSFGGNPLNGPQAGTIMQYYGGATPGQVMQPQSFGGNPLNGPQAGTIMQYYGGATPGQIMQPQSFGGNPLAGPQAGTIMQYYDGGVPGQVMQPQSFGGNPLGGPQAGTIMQYYSGGVPGQVMQRQGYGGNPQSTSIYQNYGTGQAVIEPPSATGMFALRNNLFGGNLITGAKVVNPAPAPPITGPPAPGPELDLCNKVNTCQKQETPVGPNDLLQNMFTNYVDIKWQHNWHDKARPYLPEQIILQFTFDNDEYGICPQQIDGREMPSEPKKEAEWAMRKADFYKNAGEELLNGDVKTAVEALNYALAGKDPEKDTKDKQDNADKNAKDAGKKLQDAQDNFKRAHGGQTPNQVGNAIGNEFAKATGEDALGGTPEAMKGAIDNYIKGLTPEQIQKHPGIESKLKGLSQKLNSFAGDPGLAAINTAQQAYDTAHQEAVTYGNSQEADEKYLDQKYNEASKAGDKAEMQRLQEMHKRLKEGKSTPEDKAELAKRQQEQLEHARQIANFNPSKNAKEYIDAKNQYKKREQELVDSEDITIKKTHHYPCDHTAAAEMAILMAKHSQDQILERRPMLKQAGVTMDEIKAEIDKAMKKKDKKEALIQLINLYDKYTAILVWMENIYYEYVDTQEKYLVVLGIRVWDESCCKPCDVAHGSGKEPEEVPQPDIELQHVNEPESGESAKPPKKPTSEEISIPPPSTKDPCDDVPEEWRVGSPEELKKKLDEKNQALNDHLNSLIKDCTDSAVEKTKNAIRDLGYGETPPKGSEALTGLSQSAMKEALKGINADLKRCLDDAKANMESESGVKSVGEITLTVGIDGDTINIGSSGRSGAGYQIPESWYDCFQTGFDRATASKLSVDIEKLTKKLDESKKEYDRAKSEVEELTGEEVSKPCDESKTLRKNDKGEYEWYTPGKSGCEDIAKEEENLKQKKKKFDAEFRRLQKASGRYDLSQSYDGGVEEKSGAPLDPEQFGNEIEKSAIQPAGMDAKDFAKYKAKLKADAIALENAMIELAPEWNGLQSKKDDCKSNSPKTEPVSADDPCYKTSLLDLTKKAYTSTRVSLSNSITTRTALTSKLPEESSTTVLFDMPEALTKLAETWGIPITPEDTSSPSKIMELAIKLNQYTDMSSIMRAYGKALYTDAQRISSKYTQEQKTRKLTADEQKSLTESQMLLGTYKPQTEQAYSEDRRKTLDKKIAKLSYKDCFDQLVNLETELSEAELGSAEEPPLTASAAPQVTGGFVSKVTGLFTGFAAGETSSASPLAGMRQSVEEKKKECYELQTALERSSKIQTEISKLKTPEQCDSEARALWDQYRNAQQGGTGNAAFLESQYTKKLEECSSTREKLKTLTSQYNEASQPIKELADSRLERAKLDADSASTDVDRMRIYDQAVKSVLADNGITAGSTTNERFSQIAKLLDTLGLSEKWITQTRLNPDTNALESSAPLSRDWYIPARIITDSLAASQLMSKHSKSDFLSSLNSRNIFVGYDGKSFSAFGGDMSDAERKILELTQMEEQLPDTYKKIVNGLAKFAADGGQLSDSEKSLLGKYQNKETLSDGERIQVEGIANELKRLKSRIDRINPENEKDADERASLEAKRSQLQQQYDSIAETVSNLMDAAPTIKKIQQMMLSGWRGQPIAPYSLPAKTSKILSTIEEFDKTTANELRSVINSVLPGARKSWSQQINQDRAILKDPNASSGDKSAARTRIALNELYLEKTVDLATWSNTKDAATQADSKRKEIVDYIHTNFEGDRTSMTEQVWAKIRSWMEMVGYKYKLQFESDLTSQYISKGMSPGEAVYRAAEELRKPYWQMVTQRKVISEVNKLLEEIKTAGFDKTRSREELDAYRQMYLMIAQSFIESTSRQLKGQISRLAYQQSQGTASDKDIEEWLKLAADYIGLRDQYEWFLRKDFFDPSSWRGKFDFSRAQEKLSRYTTGDPDSEFKGENKLSTEFEAALREFASAQGTLQERYNSLSSESKNALRLNGIYNPDTNKLLSSTPNIYGALREGYNSRKNYITSDIDKYINILDLPAMLVGAGTAAKLTKYIAGFAWAKAAATYAPKLFTLGRVTAEGTFMMLGTNAIHVAGEVSSGRSLWSAIKEQNWNPTSSILFMSFAGGYNQMMSKLIPSSLYRSMVRSMGLRSAAMAITDLKFLGEVVVMTGYQQAESQIEHFLKTGEWLNPADFGWKETFFSQFLQLGTMKVTSGGFKSEFNREYRTAAGLSAREMSIAELRTAAERLSRQAEETLYSGKNSVEALAEYAQQKSIESMLRNAMIEKLLRQQGSKISPGDSATQTKAEFDKWYTSQLNAIDAQLEILDPKSPTYSLDRARLLEQRAQTVRSGAEFETAYNAGSRDALTSMRSAKTAEIQSLQLTLIRIGYEEKALSLITDPQSRAIASQKLGYERQMTEALLRAAQSPYGSAEFLKNLEAAYKAATDMLTNMESMMSKEGKAALESMINDINNRLTAVEEAIKSGKPLPSSSTSEELARKTPEVTSKPAEITAKPPKEVGPSVADIEIARIRAKAARSSAKTEAEIKAAEEAEAKYKNIVKDKAESLEEYRKTLQKKLTGLESDLKELQRRQSQSPESLRIERESIQREEAKLASMLTPEVRKILADATGKSEADITVEDMVTYGWVLPGEALRQSTKVRSMREKLLGTQPYPVDEAQSRADAITKRMLEIEYTELPAATREIDLWSKGPEAYIKEKRAIEESNKETEEKSRFEEEINSEYSVLVGEGPGTPPSGPVEAAHSALLDAKKAEKDGDYAKAAEFYREAAKQYRSYVALKEAASKAGTKLTTEDRRNIDMANKNADTAERKASRAESTGKPAEITTKPPTEVGPTPLRSLPLTAKLSLSSIGELIAEKIPDGTQIILISKTGTRLTGTLVRFTEEGKIEFRRKDGRTVFIDVSEDGTVAGYEFVPFESTVPELPRGALDVNKESGIALEKGVEVKVKDAVKMVVDRNVWSILPDGTYLYLGKASEGESVLRQRADQSKAPPGFKTPEIGSTVEIWRGSKGTMDKWRIEGYEERDTVALGRIKYVKITDLSDGKTSTMPLYALEDRLRMSAQIRELGLDKSEPSAKPGEYRIGGATPGRWENALKYLLSINGKFFNDLSKYTYAEDVIKKAQTDGKLPKGPVRITTAKELFNFIKAISSYEQRGELQTLLGSIWFDAAGLATGSKDNAPLGLAELQYKYDRNGYERSLRNNLDTMRTIYAEAGMQSVFEARLREFGAKPTLNSEYMVKIGGVYDRVRIAEFYDDGVSVKLVRISDGKKFKVPIAGVQEYGKQVPRETSTAAYDVTSLLNPFFWWENLIKPVISAVRSTEETRVESPEVVEGKSAEISPKPPVEPAPPGTPQKPFKFLEPSLPESQKAAAIELLKTSKQKFDEAGGSKSDVSKGIDVLMNNLKTSTASLKEFLDKYGSSLPANERISYENALDGLNAQVRAYTEAFDGLDALQVKKYAPELITGAPKVKRITGVLGTGANGIVFAAEVEGVNGEMAVKVMRLKENVEQYQRNPEAAHAKIQKFIDEIEKIKTGQALGLNTLEGGQIVVLENGNIAYMTKILPKTYVKFEDLSPTDAARLKDVILSNIDSAIEKLLHPSDSHLGSFLMFDIKNSGNIRINRETGELVFVDLGVLQGTGQRFRSLEEAAGTKTPDQAHWVYMLEGVNYLKEVVKRVSTLRPAEIEPKPAVAPSSPLIKPMDSSQVSGQLVTAEPAVGKLPSVGAEVPIIRSDGTQDTVRVLAYNGDFITLKSLKKGNSFQSALAVFQNSIVEISPATGNIVTDVSGLESIKENKVPIIAGVLAVAILIVGSAVLFRHRPVPPLTEGVVKTELELKKLSDKIEEFKKMTEKLKEK